MISPGLEMALAVVFAGGLLFGLFKLARRVEGFRKNSFPENGIKVLTSKPIAPQKYVSLVEIGGEVLALGISAQGITFLTKIENRESLGKDLPHPVVKPEPLPWLRRRLGRQKKVGIWLGNGNGK